MWEKAQAAQEHKPVSYAPWFTNGRHVQQHKNKEAVFLYKFLSSFIFSEKNEDEILLQIYFAINIAIILLQFILQIIYTTYQASAMWYK